MRIERADRALLGGGFGISLGVILLADNPWRGVGCALLIATGVYLAVLGMMLRASGAPTARHRHTFGNWETAWYRNENGTKAGVAHQIRTCTGCGLIEKRKP